MDSRQGTFIVVETAEPSQSQSIVDRLEARLTTAGHTVLTYHFPRFHEDASYFATKYSAEEYGNPSQVSPYTASLLFALDRYDAAGSIRTALAEGSVVLCSNYTGANMSKQGAKFTYPEERRGFYIWLDNLEYQMLGIPRPDKSIVLLPLQNKDGERSEATLLELSQLFPKDFELIASDRGGTPLEEPTLDEIIWQKIVPLLPVETPDTTNTVAKQASAPKANYASFLDLSVSNPAMVLQYNSLQATKPSVAIPPLREDIVPTYRTETERLLSEFMDIKHSALGKVTVDQHQSLRNALLQLIPVAAQSAVSSHKLVPVGVTESRLRFDSQIHDTVKNVRMIGSHPNNELEALPLLLFPMSNGSWHEISDHVAGQSIGAKYDALSGLLSSQPNSLGSLYYYDFEALVDVVSAAQLARVGAQLTHQVLTPRYGFVVPEIIEQLGMSQQYEDVFRLSFELHSVLTRENEVKAAQSVCLLGHKAHYLIRVTSRQIIELRSQIDELTDTTKQLVALMLQLASEKHPTLYERTIIGS